MAEGQKTARAGGKARASAAQGVANHVHNCQRPHFCVQFESALTLWYTKENQWAELHRVYGILFDTALHLDLRL